VDIVYPHHIQRYGLSERLQTLPAPDADITRSNYITTQSLWRRWTTELVVHDTGGENCDWYDDWDVAKRALDAGAVARRADGVTVRLRHHARSSSMVAGVHGDGVHRYQQQMRRWRVTIVTLLSGRLWAVKHGLPSIYNSGWPDELLDVVLVDNSGDKVFAAGVKSMSAHLQCACTVLTIPPCPAATAGSAEYASGDDAVRRAREEQLTQWVAMLYARAQPYCTGDLVAVLEDDIEPSERWLARLAQSLRPDVAAVIAPYRSRFGLKRWLAWQITSLSPYQHQLPDERGQGVQQCGGGGFGSVLIRGREFRRAKFRAAVDDAAPHWHGHDIAFFRDLALQQPQDRVLVDWDYYSRHWDREGYV